MTEVLYSSFFSTALILSSYTILAASIITMIVIRRAPKKKLYRLVAALLIILPVAMQIFYGMGTLNNYIDRSREVKDAVTEVSQNVKETAVVTPGKTYNVCYFLNNPEDLTYSGYVKLYNYSNGQNINYTIDSLNDTVTILDTCQSGEKLIVRVYGHETATYNLEVTLEVVN